MKIAILGAGAMGCLVGAHLKRGGAEVWLIDPYVAHMEAIAEKGLHMELEGEAPVQVLLDGAVTDPSKVGMCDAAVLLCKCVDTEQTVKAARPIFGPHTVMITMQNGIGNVELLEQYLPRERLGFGVLKSSATLVAPGRIVGRTRFASGDCGLYFSPVVPEGPSEKSFKEIEVHLSRAGFSAKLTKETEALMWEKLYLNIMFNMPCALLRVAGEDFMRQPEGEALLHKIADEFCDVANAKGFPIDRAAYWELYGAPDIKRLPADTRHYTSAVIDAARKRRTEVEFITGAVCREGKKLGIPTPHNETVYGLIKVMENTYELRYIPQRFGSEET